MKLYINSLIIFSITLTKVFANYDLETDIISRNSSRPGKICEYSISNLLFFIVWYYTSCFENEKLYLSFFFSKLVNIFSVVRFPNKVCAGDSYNGTCYSSSECSTRGGSTSGTCAGGYGVCCICK